MKKQELLRKVESLFFEMNFKEVSMSKIADLLEIKKASLYYYFPSKTEFFKDLILFSEEEFDLFVDEIFELDFETFIKSYLEFPFKNKNLFSIVDESYCDEVEIKELISERKMIFEKKFLKSLDNKFGICDSKWFLLMNLLSSLSKRNCIKSSDCIVSKDEVLTQISLLFIQD